MNRFRRSWRVVLGLSWAERRLFAEAWLMLALTAAGLVLVGFRRVRPWLVPDDHSPSSRRDVPAAQFVAWLVRAAAGWCPLRATCLAQALVTCRQLREAGLAAELRIGVSRDGNSMTAHAWAEHCGVALGERREDLARFSSFNENILTRGA